jgi:uncharacterized protein (DUF3820 family)
MKKGKGNSNFNLLRGGVELQDNSPMPDKGIYKGVLMANIPAKDLLWRYDKGYCSPMVKTYIENNLEDLKNEAGQ